MASRQKIVSTLKRGYYASARKSYGQIQTEQFNTTSIGRSYKYRGDRQAFRQRMAWQAQKNIQYAKRHGLPYVSQRKTEEMLTNSKIRNLQNGLNTLGFTDFRVTKKNVGHIGHLWELAKQYGYGSPSELVREMLKYELMSQGEIIFNTLTDVYLVFKDKRW